MSHTHAVVCWTCGYTAAASSKDTLWKLRQSHGCPGQDIDLIARSEVGQ